MIKLKEKIATPKPNSTNLTKRFTATQTSVSMIT